MHSPDFDRLIINPKHLGIECVACNLDPPRFFGLAANLPFPGNRYSGASSNYNCISFYCNNATNANGTCDYIPNGGACVESDQCAAYEYDVNANSLPPEIVLSWACNNVSHTCPTLSLLADCVSPITNDSLCAGGYCARVASNPAATPLCYRAAGQSCRSEPFSLFF